MLRHLHGVWCCFCATRARLNGYDESMWSIKLKIFTFWLFTEKVCRSWRRPSEMSETLSCFLIGFKLHFPPLFWRWSFLATWGKNLGVFNKRHIQELYLQKKPSHHTLILLAWSPDEVQNSWLALSPSLRQPFAPPSGLWADPSLGVGRFPAVVKHPNHTSQGLAPETLRLWAQESVFLQSSTQVTSLLMKLL